MRIILRKTVNTAENSALKLVNLPSSKVHVIRLTQLSVHVKFEEFVARHVCGVCSFSTSPSQT